MPLRSRTMTGNQKRYTEAGNPPASKSSVADSRVVRLTPVIRLLVQRGRVFGLLVYGAAFVILGQELLDLPVVLLNADRELKIFTGDRIPVLWPS
jgi:hypothetical protein